ncbi:stage V sporulation protein E [Clostridium sp. CAG:1219]|nr:stage V sporulation protein E [Clostridium sp. CAG:1219]
MKKVNFKEFLGIDKENRGKMDFPLLVSIILLLCIGIIMVSSASSYSALSKYDDSNFFLVKQLGFAIVGFIAMIVISTIDYKKYKKVSYLFYGLTLILMILVLTPLGVSVNGAKRWLGIGDFFRFQPSEIMKIALVLATATYVSCNYKKLNSWKGYIVPAIFLLAVGIVMYLQDHLSGMIVMIVASVSIIFSSGIKLKWKVIIPIMIVGIALVGVFLFSDEYRLSRVTAFLHPEEDIRGTNWQAAQSLYALGSGEIFGLGLGQSRQKYLWLPEAQNDFIFSVLGEEFGLIGSVSVILIFLFFIYRGFRIAITCKELYGSMLAAGIVSVFALQIFVNIAVVTSSMPVTGMPLPFFSYGGTALFINLCTMGILLNISRNCK